MNLRENFEIISINSIKKQTGVCNLGWEGIKREDGRLHKILLTAKKADVAVCIISKVEICVFSTTLDQVNQKFGLRYILQLKYIF